MISFHIVELMTSFRSTDQIPDDDILHSLYRTFLINMVDKARAHCCMYGLKNMYFCGNFAQNPTGRHIIQVHNAGENVYAPKVLTTIWIMMIITMKIIMI